MNTIFLKDINNRIKKIQKYYKLYQHNYIDKLYHIGESFIFAKLDSLLFGNRKFFYNIDIDYFPDERSIHGDEDDDDDDDDYSTRKFNKLNCKNPNNNIPTTSNNKYNRIVSTDNKDSIFIYFNRSNINYIRDKILKLLPINTDKKFMFLTERWIDKKSERLHKDDITHIFDTEYIIYKGSVQQTKVNGLYKTRNAFLNKSKNTYKIKYQISLLISSDKKSMAYRTLVLYNNIFHESTVVITSNIDILRDINNKNITRCSIDLNTNISRSSDIISVSNKGDSDNIKIFTLYNGGHNSKIFDIFSSFITSKDRFNGIITPIIYTYLESFFLVTNRLDVDSTPSFIKLPGLSSTKINFIIDEKKSDINYYELPYFKSIENKIDDSIINNKTGIFSNFIINGPGGTGKTFYTKNILSEKYRDKLFFITIDGISISYELEDEYGQKVKGSSSNNTSNLLRLAKNFNNIITDLYKIMNKPICIIWDEFENTIMASDNVKLTTLTMKRIIDLIYELNIPVFFIFLTNDYKVIEDETFYRRGRIDYIVDIKDDSNIKLDVIKSKQSFNYFIKWVEKNNKDLDISNYKINEISFIENRLKVIDTINNDNSKDIICERIYNDIKSTKQ